MSATDAPSATERAYAHVKAGVVDGSYAGGDLLTEGGIAEAVGVSRTPVREALLRLESEGLVKLYPKKGALVVPVTARETEDVLEARRLVDTWAAQRAWSERVRLLPQLEAQLAEMRGARDGDDVVGFAAADRSFHEFIVTAAGNDILTRLYGSLRDRQLCINAAAMRVSAARMDVAIAEHESLLDAMRHGDEQAFLDRTSAHVHTSAQNIRGVR